MDRRSPAVLSLCTGAGGLELGLKLALPCAHAVCYVEGEAYAAAQLAARMDEETLDEAPVWSDVRTFDPGPWRGRVDIVTAGYPCQPFSIAGKKQAEADPRHLWPFIREIVRIAEPKICFFENVAHHLRLGFEQVHDDLCAMGYRVAAGLFTAEEVGAPHRRERLFILAHAEGAGAWLDQFDPWQGIAGDGSASLADPDGAGLEGYPRYEPASGGTSFAAAHGLPLWPPGPGEFDAWGAVPNPLKPAIHRMADGMADRVDRIRACGNGVVPLAAAYAFRTLHAAIDR